MAGWADSTQCLASHITASVSLVAENVKPTFALMLSQEVQPLVIWVLLFLAHTPVGGLQKCQDLHMEVSHFSLPYFSGTHLAFLSARERSLTKGMLVIHGQQSVFPRSCPITSWDHPGVDTTVPMSLGRPSQGVAEQWCPRVWK